MNITKKTQLGWSYSDNPTLLGSSNDTPDGIEASLGVFIGRTDASGGAGRLLKTIKYIKSSGFPTRYVQELRVLDGMRYRQMTRAEVLQLWVVSAAGAELAKNHASKDQTPDIVSESVH